MLVIYLYLPRGSHGGPTGVHSDKRGGVAIVHAMITVEVALKFAIPTFVIYVPCAAF